MQLMELRNKLYDLDRNICEEKTKLYLVLPLIAYLGYDVFSHFDIIPEYKPRYYTGNDRVDYAICDDEIPKIFVEAKRLRTDLKEDHVSWLAKYFNSDPFIKLGILTNGERYLFFTDSVHENIMDTKPFFELNLKTYHPLDEYLMEYFSKGNLNGSSVEFCMKTISEIRKIKNAFMLIYANQEYFKELRENGDENVMREIYKIAKVNEEDIPLKLAFTAVPIHRL